MTTSIGTESEIAVNNRKQLDELVLQSLEHKRSGLLVYEVAVNCAQNPELRERWQRHMSETQSHIDTLERLCSELGIDSESDTPGRQVVRHIGQALVNALELALLGDDPVGAELIACECVVLAETKEHLNWTLIGTCAVGLGEAERAALRAAYRDVKREEDEHLYHAKGWCRELWLHSLGLNSVLPPPEELRRVATTSGVAKVAAQRTPLRLLG